VFGFDSDSFQVVTLSNDVGSVPLSSPVATPFGVFFWYADQGAYLYNREGFVWIFDKMSPAVDDGRISFTTNPQLGWGNNKLYVSVDWTEDGSTTRRTLIYDPTIAGGAWVTTDIDAAAMYSYRPPNDSSTVYGACVANTGVLIDVEDEQNRSTDRYASSAETHISSYFVTRWVSGKNPIVKKRWGRPRMVTSAEATISLPVSVFKDYDKSAATGSFNVSISGKTSTSLWGTAKWDDGDDTSPYWAAWDAISRDLTAVVLNLPTLGTAKSISVKVSGPTSNNHWEMNALAFAYTPRRLR
jgi:hypothetical protein